MPSNEQGRRDALPSGTVLRDYRIERVLGHGGFGIVYQARHNDLGNLVAIKEYLPVELAIRDGPTVQLRNTESRGLYEEGLRRFLDEAKALVGFHDCPSIVSCRDFFRCNSTAYLVMEYEHGLPLSDLLQQREAVWRPFEESDLRAVIIPLLEGLAQVHEAEVLHRDIKPANILVRRSDEQPVLIDFGAAKQVVAEHSKSMAPYTDGYAAWEQVGEGELGPWTDMYGVGAVMWRMVAGGNPPWEPPNPVKVERRANAVMRGAADPLPSACELGAGRFSPAVLDAVDRCLKLNEEERIRDSVELLGLLRTESGTVEAPDAVRPQVDEQSELERAPKGRGLPEKFQLLSEGAFAAGLPHKDRSTKQRVGIAAAGLLAGVLILALLLMRPESNVASEFRIEAHPEDATVVLLNSEERYRAGMRLAPGRYEVEVSAPGYETRREEVEHGELRTSHRIELETVTADRTASQQQGRQRPQPVKQRQQPQAQRPKAVADAPKSKDTGGSREDTALARAGVQWNEVKDSKDRDVLQAFVEEYMSVAGANVWVKLAESRLAELDNDAGDMDLLDRAESLWMQVKDSQDREVLQAFVEEYALVAGANVWVKLAESRLTELDRDTLQASLPSPPQIKKKAAPKRIRVGGNIAQARLQRQVGLQYPPLARKARVQGTVKLSAIIAKDGSIKNLESTQGHPLLVPAALAAVKKWRYKPTLLNGEAVEVQTSIDVNFKLND